MRAKETILFYFHHTAKRSSNPLQFCFLLVIACQFKEGNLEEFLAHENKSHLQHFLKEVTCVLLKGNPKLSSILEQPAGHRVNERPLVEGKLLDDPAMVNMWAATKGGTALLIHTHAMCSCAF